jgi:23S rRNA (uridine2552-2'-O)-methyltransferase
VSGKRGAGKWLRSHLRDPFVREASARGYRSRAALKLIQIDDRQRLLRPGACVVDLGAAPGGWTQVAVERVGSRGRVVAVDLLDMAPVHGATVLRGDFTDPGVRAHLQAQLRGVPVDLVMSDMAPNLTGMKDADQARAGQLAAQALEFAVALLREQGAVLIKLFHGAGMEEVVAQARTQFRSVSVRKPPASRSRSAETYLLGRGPDGIF